MWPAAAMSVSEATALWGQFAALNDAGKPRATFRVVDPPNFAKRGPRENHWVLVSSEAASTSLTKCPNVQEMLQSTPKNEKQNLNASGSRLFGRPHPVQRAGQMPSAAAGKPSAVETSADTPEAEGTKKGWTCPHCGKFFKKEGLCSKKHLVKAHGDLDSIDDPKLRDFLATKMMTNPSPTKPIVKKMDGSVMGSDDSRSLHGSPVKGRSVDTSALKNGALYPGLALPGVAYPGLPLPWTAQLNGLLPFPGGSQSSLLQALAAQVQVNCASASASSRLNSRSPVKATSSRPHADGTSRDSSPAVRSDGPTPQGSSLGVLSRLAQKSALQRSQPKQRNGDADSSFHTRSPIHWRNSSAVDTRTTAAMLSPPTPRRRKLSFKDNKSRGFGEYSVNISDKCVMMGGILNDSEEAEEQRDNDTEVVYDGETAVIKVEPQAPEDSDWEQEEQETAEQGNTESEMRTEQSTRHETPEKGSSGSSLGNRSTNASHTKTTNLPDNSTLLHHYQKLLRGQIAGGGLRESEDVLGERQVALSQAAASLPQMALPSVTAALVGGFQTVSPLGGAALQLSPSSSSGGMRRKREYAKSTELAWKCPECEKCFKKIGAHAEKHLAGDHGWDLQRIEQYLEECRKDKYKCAECGKVFKTPAAMRKHQKREKSYSCELCGVLFRTDRFLVNHLQVAHSDVQLDGTCPVCSAVFSDVVALHEHLAVHADEKRFACTSCDKSFCHEDFLKRHTELHNLPELQERVNSRAVGLHPRLRLKDKECRICGKQFAKKSHLEGHMATHTKQKNHACDICSKTFSRRSHLRLHLLKHTGVRPYSCMLCDQTFTEAYSLRRHERIHLGIKPYQCPLCKGRYLRMEKLRSHLEKNHPNHGLDLTSHSLFKVMDTNQEKELMATLRKDKNLLDLSDDDSDASPDKLGDDFENEAKMDAEDDDNEGSYIQEDADSEDDEMEVGELQLEEARSETMMDGQSDAEGIEETNPTQTNDTVENHNEQNQSSDVMESYSEELSTKPNKVRNFPLEERDDNEGENASTFTSKPNLLSNGVASKKYDVSIEQTLNGHREARGTTPTTNQSLFPSATNEGQSLLSNNPVSTDNQSLSSLEESANQSDVWDLLKTFSS